MPRYIDIDAFRKEHRMNEHCEDCERNARECQYNDFSMMDFCGWLDNAPTVDAAPVKHGKWVMDEEPHDGDVRCSVCLIAIDQMHERNHKLLNALTGGKWYTFYHYCPRCGAKMDLEEQDAKEET